MSVKVIVKEGGSGGGGGGAVSSVNTLIGDVVLTADNIGDGTTNKAFTDTEKTKLAGIATGANVNTVTSVASRTGAVTLAKADVGLSNVDNTSDVNKPVSTATTTQLNLKAPIASPSFTGTVSGVTKTHVGLGSVDNTTDVNKPISTATQTALNNKVDVDGAKVLSDVNFTSAKDSKLTGIETGATADQTNAEIKTAYEANSDTNAYTDTEKSKLSGIATGAQVNIVTSVASKTGAVTLAKADVGLGSVDNTADTAKPVSTAMTTALNLKANLASPTFTGTVSGVTKTHVGLANVDNTSDVNKPVSTATTTALNLKANLASPTFTGTVSGVTKAMVGLTSVVDADTTNATNISSGTLNALRLPSAIDATKIGDGTISNAEFQYLNNVSSNIQTQLDSKGGAVWDIDQKITVTQTMVSSTTYVDLTGVTATLDASSIYSIEVDIFGYVDSGGGAPHGTPNFKLAYSGTSTDSSIVKIAGSGTTWALNTVQNMGVLSLTGQTYKGYIITNATGTLKLQFAQNTIDADTTYAYKGCGFRLKKLA